MFTDHISWQKTCLKRTNSISLFVCDWKKVLWWILLCCPDHAFWAIYEIDLWHYSKRIEFANSSMFVICFYLNCANINIEGPLGENKWVVILKRLVPLIFCISMINEIEVSKLFWWKDSLLSEAKNNNISTRPCREMFHDKIYLFTRSRDRNRKIFSRSNETKALINPTRKLYNITNNSCWNVWANINFIRIIIKPFSTITIKTAIRRKSHKVSMISLIVWPPHLTFLISTNYIY